MIEFDALHDLRRYTVPRCWASHTQSQALIRNRVRSSRYTRPRSQNRANAQAPHCHWCHAGVLRRVPPHAQCRDQSAMHAKEVQLL